METQNNYIENLINIISSQEDSLSSLARDIEDKEFNFNNISKLLNKKEYLLDQKDSLTEQQLIPINDTNYSFIIVSHQEFDELITLLNNIGKVVDGRRINKADFNQENLENEIQKFRVYLLKIISKLDKKISLLKNIAAYYEVLKIKGYIKDSQEVLHSNKQSKFSREIITDNLLKAKSVKNLKYLKLFDDNSESFYIFPKSTPLINKINWTYRLKDNDLKSLEEIIDSILNRFEKYELKIIQNLSENKYKENISPDEENMSSDENIFIEEKEENINTSKYRQKVQNVQNEIKKSSNALENNSDLEELFSYLKKQTQMLNQLELTNFNNSMMISNSIIVLFTSFNTLLEIIKSKIPNLYEELLDNRKKEIERYKYPLLTNTLGLKNAVELNNFIILLNQLESIVFNTNFTKSYLFKNSIFNILNLLISSSAQITNKILKESHKENI